VAGLVAGSTGAVITWSGVAFAALSWRVSHLALIGIDGGLLGLLLPPALELNQLLLLYIPWQSGVGGLLGLLLGSSVLGAPERQLLPKSG
jgi:hypothetical protein